MTTSNSVLITDNDASALAVTSNPPSVCSAGDLDGFQLLVLEGREVNLSGLRQRIARAERLAFALLDHNLVGVGALKYPHTAYRKSVFMKSGSSHPPAAFPLELGWVYVKPECRGRSVSRHLLQELMATVRDRPIFATSRTDNHAMHKSLERFGFVRNGRPYASGMRAKKLQLYVRVDTPIPCSGRAALRPAERQP